MDRIHADQVTFLGSAGVALVIRLVKRAAPNTVQLVHPTRTVLRPLQAMGVAPLLHVVE